MAITVDRVVEIFEDVEAATPIVCNWSLFAKAEVHVYFGLARDEAIPNVDYVVTLAAPGYATFTITPTTSLITKINGLIALNDDETNYIEVRRILDMLTAITPASARDTANVAREFERYAQRFQQMNERLIRTPAVPVVAIGEDEYDLTYPAWEADKAITWHPTEKRFINSAYSVNTSPTALAIAAADVATTALGAIEVLAEEAVDNAEAAEAARIAAEAAAGSVNLVPSGGDTGDILTRTGPGDAEYVWATPAVVDVAAALAGAGADTVPADDDTLAGSLADDTIAKWTFASIRTWILTFLANLLVRTGQIGYFLTATPPSGWTELNGGSIGNAASGGTNRANADTAGLYAVIWELNVLDAPIQTSAGAASTKGANAAEDFAADKRLVLPDSRGVFPRGLDGGRGLDPSRRLGSYQTWLVGPHQHPVIVSADGTAHQHVVTANGSSRRGINGSNAGSTWAGSSGDTPDGNTGQVVSGSAGSHIHSALADQNRESVGTGSSDTENRPYSLAFLCCVKL